MPEDIPGGDMSSCIAEFESEGHDEDAAARICEALSQEAKSENGNVEELKAAIERGRGLIADVAVDLNSAVDRPAADSTWVMFKSVADAPGENTAQIDAPMLFKADESADAREEKRIAYAPAMVPRDIDKEGDVVPTHVVESAAHDYLKRGGGVDADHDLVDGKGTPVESWIEPDARTWELPDGTEKEYPAGTWMLGIQWEGETWKRIQEGDLQGLSIYGQGDHVDLQKDFRVPYADESVVNVLYASRSVAAKAAEEMGFEGPEAEITHPHEFGDQTHYMPAPDHDAYVDRYNEFAEADEVLPAPEETVEATAKDEDPCWEGYTMVGTKPNGNPRCVPDDDVPDADFDRAVEYDGSASPPGATPTNEAAKSDTQNTEMTDPDDPTVDKEAFESLKSTVDELKEAVETEKQDEEEAAAMLAEAHDTLSAADLLDVFEATDGMDLDAVMSALQDAPDEDEGDTEEVESEAKENDGDDEEDDKSEDGTETAKSEETPHFKGGDGSDAAATAKNVDTAAAGIPSYADALEQEDA